MRLLRKVPKGLPLDAPLLHADHRRPVTRRDFLSTGLTGGSALVMVPTLGGLLGARNAHAATLSPDIDALKAACGITAGAGKIPFICFDLSGGANIAGSNVLMGGQGGQLDFLTTAGYSKLGIPGNMTPNLPTFTDTTFGLAFHSDSAFLRGIKMRAVTASTAANTNGTVIAARSENDTGNNPHNPMYGIYKAGADGQLLTLIGSQSSESGGNSMAPAALIDLSVRPTKVDRASDVTGLVDTGELGTLFSNPQDSVSVLESIVRLSDKKMARVQTKMPSTDPLRTDASMKQFMQCGYVKSTYLAANFSQPAALNPSLDTRIVGSTGIWTQAEYDGDAEFRKTAAVMKMVIDGNAGAGTIQMGGFDYHTGDRSTGELRDLRAGQCMGACLEYAQRTGKPVMIYVFSDGSLSSNGMIDNSVNGRGKGVWTGDNQATASSFFLVFSPTGRPALADGLGGVAAARKQQIGFFTGDGSVSTTSSPAANAVNLLVQTVILNYMALHGEQGQFAGKFGNALGGSAQLDALTAFAPIVNGTI